jgi:hypothetical protein
MSRRQRFVEKVFLEHSLEAGVDPGCPRGELSNRIVEKREKALPGY